MKLILLYFTIFTSLLLANPFKLNKNDLQTIRKSYDSKKIIVRYKRFNQFLKEAKSYNELKKITRTNSYINKILPGIDKVVQQQTDHWSTPKEFLIKGKGDCEDYAISKYFTLKQLGVDPKKLYLAIVKVKGSKTMHMVLLYFETKRSIPLVLDNLSWRTLGLNKRKDLKVKVIFNEKDAHLIYNNKIGRKVKINWGKPNRWYNLLNRIYKKKN
jgi:predicted transglutaminase-like cysteine proteinase